MFEDFAKKHTLRELNDFQKAMTNLRANAKTKSQKLASLRKQIKYFDLLGSTQDKIVNKDTYFRFMIPADISKLTASEVDKVWRTFKPKYQKSKKHELQIM